ncbi:MULTISPECIES: hypothetical protein [unclassified Sphingobacterium]|uniref:hypothetical protein n=1 Tax=unclassified Sphingobacterium TaxID=2609468 RepID=UPI0020C27977|nr:MULTISPECIES: hypothetical protein [unclassified Sphingobacterium]
MLVRVISGLLMLLSVLVGFQQAIIVMHFKLNQEKIEMAYCENKNKPEMQCHGLCHLKKQLEDQENSETAPPKNYPRVDMLVATDFEFILSDYDSECSEVITGYQEVYYKEPLREIFIPPPIYDIV